MWIGHPRCPPLQDKFIIRFYEETLSETTELFDNKHCWNVSWDEIKYGFYRITEFLPNQIHILSRKL
jgi:hypothetical protein